TAGGRHPLQRHRRLPRRDGGGRGRAGALPHRGPPRRRRGLRLLGRGRHRGREPGRQGRPGRDRATGGSHHPARRGADRPARRGAGRADRGRARRGGRRRERRGLRPLGPPGPRHRRAHPAHRRDRGAGRRGPRHGTRRGYGGHRPGRGGVAVSTEPRPPAAAAELPEPSPWNLPNALTVLRILLVPVFVWLVLRHGGDETASRWWAFLVFAIAIITDRIDGDLARAKGLVTTFGKVADPIADKALTGAGFITLSMIGQIPWWITVVILAREIGITAMRFWV